MTSMYLIDVDKMGSYGNFPQMADPPSPLQEFGLILPGFFAHVNWAVQLK